MWELWTCRRCSYLLCALEADPAAGSGDAGFAAAVWMHRLCLARCAPDSPVLTGNIPRVVPPACIPAAPALPAALCLLSLRCILCILCLLALRCLVLLGGARTSLAAVRFAFIPGVAVGDGSASPRLLAGWTRLSLLCAHHKMKSRNKNCIDAPRQPHKSSTAAAQKWCSL